jgi:hypothetical protein
MRRLIFSKGNHQLESRIQEIWQSGSEGGAKRTFVPTPILIGKRAGSRYEAGKRTGAWIKLKLHLEQEFVIGGYTDPEGGRKYFGSLLVGFYGGKNLKFAGRVGTGFSVKRP